MAEDKLEAFIVKRRKVLLPKITIEKYEDDTDWYLAAIVGYAGDTFWYSAKRDMNKEILIEAKEKTPHGYCLYGTEIPVIFCYPRGDVKTLPNMKACIGVETRQWEISKTMQLNHPNAPFYYNGKYITDEDVITWLENEKNIDSMKRVKEWAIQYIEECKKVRESIHQREVKDVRSRRYSRHAEEEKQHQKVKEMVDRRSKLVSKYQ